MFNEKITNVLDGDRSGKPSLVTDVLQSKMSET